VSANVEPDESNGSAITTADSPTHGTTDHAPKSSTHWAAFKSPDYATLTAAKFQALFAAIDAAIWAAIAPADSATDNATYLISNKSHQPADWETLRASYNETFTPTDFTAHYKSYQPNRTANKAAFVSAIYSAYFKPHITN
jgi:hypothetical protein